MVAAGGAPPCGARERFPLADWPAGASPARALTLQSRGHGGVLETGRAQVRLSRQGCQGEPGGVTAVRAERGFGLGGAGPGSHRSLSPPPQLHPLLADLRPGRARRHEAAVQSGGGEGSGGHGENSETQKGVKCKWVGWAGCVAGALWCKSGLSDSL